MKFANVDDQPASAAALAFTVVTISGGSGGGAEIGPSTGAPRLQSSTPADNAASGVSVNPTIVLHFNQLMNIGIGDIIITDGAAQTVINRTSGLPTTRIVGATDTRTINVDGAGVTVSDYDVTIHLAQALKPGTTYSVQMAPGVLQGVNQLSYAGLLGSTKLNFTTSSDITPPSATSAQTTEAPGPYKVGDTISITVSFSESVELAGTPELKLETGNTDRNATYFSGNHSNTLVFHYTVQAGDFSNELGFLGGGVGMDRLVGAVADEAGNLLDGAHISFSSLGTAFPDNFGTHSRIAVDGVAPTVDHWSLASGATGVNAATGVTITFSEAIALGSGDLFAIGDLHSDIVIPHIASNSPNVTLIANVITLTNLPANLDQLITLFGSAVTDLAGNPITGLPELHVSTIPLPDTIAPTLVNLPTSTISPNAFNITMSESVHAGTGTIMFTNEAGLVFRIATSTLTYNGAIITVPNTLPGNHTYNVQIEAGALLDSAGNPNILIVGTAPLLVQLSS